MRWGLIKQASLTNSDTETKGVDSFDFLTGHNIQIGISLEFIGIPLEGTWNLIEC